MAEPEPEPEPLDRCLTNLTDVSVIDSDGYKYRLNGETTYNPDIRYLLYNGTYVFKDIPETYPMAILNNKKRYLISYTGNNKAGTIECQGGNYDFYYGDITVRVFGDFGTVSVYSLNDGYMGGKNLLVYSESCNTKPKPDDPVICCPKPSLIGKQIIYENGKKFIKPKSKVPTKKMRKAYLLKNRIK